MEQIIIEIAVSMITAVVFSFIIANTIIDYHNEK